MSDMIYSHPLRVADLPQRKVTRVTLTPEAADLDRIASELDLSALRKVRFVVTLSPGPGPDWTLAGQLGATVVQPCGVTLEPVTSRVEEDVARHYAAHWTDSTDGEGQIDGDDDQEPLPAVIDLGQVLVEELSLALPMFPRASGLEALELQAAPPGAAPIQEEDVKPFAGLAALKAKLEGDAGDN